MRRGRDGETSRSTYARTHARTHARAHTHTHQAHTHTPVVADAVSEDGAVEVEVDGCD